jgi:hypothetical protein
MLIPQAGYVLQIPQADHLHAGVRLGPDHDLVPHRFPPSVAGVAGGRSLLDLAGPH